jgi:hypothetical protein
MNWSLAATIGVPGALVVVGWFFAHWLTARRDLAAKRREARLRALEAAYMRLATSCNRELTPDLVEKIETFVAEIQLYGTPHQIDLMAGIVDGFKQPTFNVPTTRFLQTSETRFEASFALKQLAAVFGGSACTFHRKRSMRLE